MPRKFFQRITPSEHIRGHPSLRFLGSNLQDPHLWHLTRHSVSLAFFIGLSVAFIPLPGQMAIAALLALALRANLAISVTLVWISNPITIPPLFYLAHWLGNSLLQIPENHFEFEASLNWLGAHLAHNWQPFLLGCLLLGLGLGLIGYFSIRIIWRFYAVSRWQQRQHRKLTAVRKEH